MPETYRADQAPLLETEKVNLNVMEPAPGKYCIHCDVFEWSKETYKEMMEQWGEVIEELYKAQIDEVYAIIGEEATKVRKFAEMFGFEESFNIDYETDKGTTGTLVLYTFPIKQIIEAAA